MRTTPFAATVEHLAGRLVDQRVALAASWLGQLKQIVPVDAHDVFPTPTLLDHIPDLIAQIGLYLRVSDAQALEANDAIMQKATELGLLRFDQRAPVGQLLREYEVFSEILDRFWRRETEALGRDADASAAVLVVSRSHKAVRALQQRTVDVLVASYTDRIERRTAQLRTFSQLVSHEIRQPLGVLQVVARVLQNPADASEGPRMVETLERNVVHLGEVAGKLERMARLTHPSRELATPALVQVSEVVDGLLAQCADTAASAGVTFEIGAHLPVLVARGQRTRHSQGEARRHLRPLHTCARAPRRRTGDERARARPRHRPRLHGEHGGLGDCRVGGRAGHDLHARMAAPSAVWCVTGIRPQPSARTRAPHHLCARLAAGSALGLAEAEWPVGDLDR